MVGVPARPLAQLAQHAHELTGPGATLRPGTGREGDGAMRSTMAAAAVAVAVLTACSGGDPAPAPTTSADPLAAAQAAAKVARPKGLQLVDARFGQCIDRTTYGRNLGQAEGGLDGRTVDVWYPQVAAAGSDARIHFRADVPAGTVTADTDAVKVLTAAGCYRP